MNTSLAHPATRTLLTALLAAPLALTGCVVYVHESGSASSYSPYSGTDLRLVILPDQSERTDELHPDEAIVGSWRGEGRFTSPPSTKFVAYGLEIRDDRGDGVSRRYMSANKDEIAGLPSEPAASPQPLLFSIQRDAGALIFEGQRDGSIGSGTVRFRRNDSFASAASSLSGRPLSTSELFLLATRGITQADIDELRAAGQSLSPGQIVRLRDQGVSGAYLRDINAAGLTSYTLDEAVRLRNHGVSADYIRGMREAGIAPAADDVIRLRDAGISADFARELHESDGREPPRVPDIVRLRNAGVRASTIADLRRAGYDFSIDDTIRLNNHGVSAAYARDVRGAGYEPSADDLIRLRNYGVSTQYLKDLQDPGKPTLPIDAVIDARSRGLSADFVKRLRQ
ncbi:MAG: hypothetical protein AB7G11_13425 [Phycisphaerales bacterium]